MFNICDYTDHVGTILAEGGKYFVLLVLCILAIRLWRRWCRVRAARNTSSLILACVVTVAAGFTGYFSMRHSLATMDTYFGIQAYDNGRLEQAAALFEASERNWLMGDTLGRHGVCLLYLGQGNQGVAMLAQARAMRRGEGTPFEFMNEGWYDFIQGNQPDALKFLRAAAKDLAYRWPATKIIAVIELDQNQIAAAAEEMKPYLQFEVTDFEQAYVLATLKLADGHKEEARTLLNKFPAPHSTTQWQTRYDQLLARLQN